MLSGNTLADVRFDLDEIKAILHDLKHSEGMKEVMTQPIRDYLKSLLNYYAQAPGLNTDNELLSRTTQAVDDILAMLRA